MVDENGYYCLAVALRGGNLYHDAVAEIGPPCAFHGRQPKNGLERIGWQKSPQSSRDRINSSYGGGHHCEREEIPHGKNA
jgi:hypothetical protein